MFLGVSHAPIGAVIVIGPVCCGAVITITRKCVHRSSPIWVCRWR